MCQILWMFARTLSWGFLQTWDCNGSWLLYFVIPTTQNIVQIQPRVWTRTLKHLQGSDRRKLSAAQLEVKTHCHYQQLFISSAGPAEEQGNVITADYSIYCSTAQPFTELGQRRMMSLCWKNKRIHNAGILVRSRRNITMQFGLKRQLWGHWALGPLCF